MERVTDTSKQQIVLVDAPAVLGWRRWLEFGAEHGSRTLKEGLSELTEAGIIEVASEEALSHLLSGALNQAALWVAGSPHPESALEEVKGALEHLLGSLKRPHQPW